MPWIASEAPSRGGSFRGALAATGWLPPLLVFLVAAALYANTLGFEFVWDDHWLILDNPRIADPTYIKYLLFERKLWRPLLRVSLIADYALWGPDTPAGFHLTNVLLHAVVCVALYFLARRLNLGRRTATLVALLFAAHPVHVEAVANVLHRKEAMALLFYLLGFILYLRARSDVVRPGPLMCLATRIGLATEQRVALARWELWAYAWACYLLGMLCKEVAAVMFPATVVVYEMVASGERREKLRRLAAFLVPIGLVLLLFSAQGYLGSLPRRFSGEQVLWVTGGQTSSYAVMLLTAIKAFAGYTRLLVWPWPLYLDRSFSLAKGLSDPWVLAGAGLLALYTAGLVWSGRRAPLVSFSLWWYGLNLLPVVNVVPLTYWLLAERFLYAPSVGFALLVGLAFQALAKGRVEGAAGRRRRQSVVAAAMALLSVHGFLTVRQNRVWKDNESLWTHTLRHNPSSYRGLYSLGWVLLQKGEGREAETFFRRSIELNVAYPEPRYALAYLLSKQARYLESIAHAEAYARLEDDDPEPLVLIGNAAIQLQQHDLALLAFRQALERDPEHRTALFNLALLLHSLGRDGEALEVIQSGLELGQEPDLLELRRRVAEVTEANARDQPERR